MKVINNTRFATEEEFTDGLTALRLSDMNYPAAGVPLFAKSGTVYIDACDSHSIIYGSTGSKKTRLIAMPTVKNICKSGESFVVTDPKGEIFRETVKLAEKKGYRILYFNLREFEAGHKWNMLELAYEYYRENMQAKATELVQEMVSVLVGEGNTKDPFWDNCAKDVLFGLVFLLFYSLKDTSEECNLSALVCLWEEYKKNKKVFLEKVRREFESTIIGTKLAVLSCGSDKTVGSIDAVVDTALNKLVVNNDFMDFLSKSDYDLSEEIKGKTAIYLVVPDENTTYHFVVTLFLSQLYEVLIREAQSREGNMLEYRMNFVLDEFANIPTIMNMDAKITAARSRNIRFHLFVQGMSQMEAKYGKDAKLICGNCSNWIYLYSKEYELLQTLSQLCGEMIYDTGLRVPLVSTFDLQHLSKEKGEALVLANRKFPFITRLLDIDEYPE